MLGCWERGCCDPNLGDTHSFPPAPAEKWSDFYTPIQREGFSKGCLTMIFHKSSGSFLKPMASDESWGKHWPFANPRCLCTDHHCFTRHLAEQWAWKPFSLFSNLQMFFHDMSHFKLWKLFPIWVDELFGFLLWDSLLLIVIGLSGCRPHTVHFAYHLGNL